MSDLNSHVEVLSRLFHLFEKKKIEIYKQQVDELSGIFFGENIYWGRN